MAQGRGNAYAAAMLLIIVGLQSCSLWLQASAATYTVGGSKGWAIGVDYTTWAAGQTFHAGDILFFPYAQSEHDVVVVDKAGYDACSEANAVATYSTGNTSVTLTGTGTHYYLCSVVGHCSAGMKLAVTVSAAAAAPAPTASPPASVPSASPPATVPPTSPPASASAPSETPSSSPITTPSTAPSPTSTPSSAPAPSPSGETPASVPSPSSPGSSPSAAPSSPGTPTSSPPPPPPNASPSVLVSAAFAPLLSLLAALLAIY